jgi:leader peptidase (prepilin peptidase)/N-methyltransferase
VIDPVFDLFLLVASPFIGSFVTAAANAWPDWSKVGMTRSACSACGRVLGPHELMPIASYVIQRGKCRACEAAIWPGHPIGEALCLFVAIGAVLAGAGPLETGLAALLGWVLVYASLVDWRLFLLPDVATLPLIPLGILAAWLRGGADFALLAAVGAAVGFGILWGLAEGYRRFRGREGLGMGDAKLLAVAGAWTDVFSLAWILLAAAMATLAGVAIYRMRGGAVSGDLAVPFGPGIAAAAFLAHLAALAGISPLRQAVYF